MLGSAAPWEGPGAGPGVHVGPQRGGADGSAPVRHAVLVLHVWPQARIAASCAGWELLISRQCPESGRAPPDQVWGGCYHAIDTEARSCRTTACGSQAKSSRAPGPFLRWRTAFARGND